MIHVEDVACGMAIQLDTGSRPVKQIDSTLVLCGWSVNRTVRSDR